MVKCLFTRTPQQKAESSQDVAQPLRPERKCAKSQREGSCEVEVVVAVNQECLEGSGGIWYDVYKVYNVYKHATHIGI